MTNKLTSYITVLLKGKMALNAEKTEDNIYTLLLQKQIYI